MQCITDLEHVKNAFREIVNAPNNDIDKDIVNAVQQDLVQKKIMQAVSWLKCQVMKVKLSLRKCFHLNIFKI